ncbi:hypothetical protein T265_01492 [Opisthorchis viverrini]|uniref:Uncharacterized protein n=1 Tax=Opisthorchis viverrini TaxID=6198 RepID=A0A075A2F4_OPIVI|nr:hypothetical protein T265_01492 [Opisthorchis viverrini]KER32437.1 hypothetical protein T265_01492 [Opisthorchis viverrini]
MMNGHSSRPAASAAILAAGRAAFAPAYSLIRDVNGLPNKNHQPVGRYTAVSKKVTKSNGTTKGMYYPASSTISSTHNAVLDPTKRSQSQQHVERSFTTNLNQNVPGSQSQKCVFNGGLYSSAIEPSTINGSSEKLASQTQHSKSHSVTSTFFIRGDTARDAAISRETGNRSAGGSLSCGQPSPSSTTEGSVASALSPTSLRVETRPQHQSFWLHQSELTLPTERDLPPGYVNGVGHSVPDKRVASVPGLEAGIKAQTVESLSNLPSADTRYFSTTSMNYGNQHSRTDSEDYLNNYAAGPSFRKIQNLHGSGGAQRRFPSDNTLNFTPRDGAQVYTSGSKPGPVTIPARSRSAQPSPGPSPLASPNTFYRASETNLNQDYGADKRSRITRSQQFELQTPARRGASSPPNLDKQKSQSFVVNGTEDDAESPILPSVREIIRQVEAMTQSNAATSTTDISTIGQGGGPPSGIPRYQRQLTQPVQNRRNASASTDNYARNGILRQGGSSQRTPSAPQLRATQYTPMQAKFNSITAAASAASAQNRNVAPPVPPHGTTRSSKAIIGAFTRRVDPVYNDTSQPQRYEMANAQSVNKKTELLSHLPNDYQKLREAFIEQRREIQRLRKQLAEKDLLIGQLQSDIRLYEPWR